MIVFQDTTFCNNPNCKCGPDRKWTPDLAIKAQAWWTGMEGPVPIAFTDFCKGVESTHDQTDGKLAGETL